MIQLATSPDAARAFRPVQGEGKPEGQEFQRRSGHPWPFISRAVRAQQPTTTKPNASSGS